MIAFCPKTLNLGNIIIVVKANSMKVKIIVLTKFTF